MFLAFIPLHSFEAFEGSLQPSMANISLPIKPISSQMNKTFRNSGVISLSMLEIKSAMAV